MKSFYSCISLPLFLLCGCGVGPQNGYVKEFPVVKDIAAEPLEIREIIKFYDIYLLEDYLVLRNGADSPTEFFYVYSYPGMDFLYSFARHGRGPDEYLLPSGIKGLPGNRFGFRDHGTDMFAYYTLTDTGAVPDMKFGLPAKDFPAFPPGELTFPWEINYISDDTYLLKRNNAKWSRRELWDLENLRLKGYLENTFDIKKRLKEDYFTDFDDYWIVTNDSRAAFGYFFIDRIELAKVDGEQLVPTGHIGAESFPDFHTYDRKPNPDGFNVDNNIVHYENMYATANYVYGLYSGKTWGETDQIHSSRIEIYDWQGEPVMLLNLEENLSNFVVDEPRRQIIGFDFTNSADYLVSYKF